MDLQGIPKSLRDTIMKFPLKRRPFWRTDCWRSLKAHPKCKQSVTDWNLSSTELEPGNPIRAFLQIPAPVLDKISGSMGSRFLSSTGLGFGTLIQRERNSSQHQHWIRIGLPEWGGVVRCPTVSTVWVWVVFGGFRSVTSSLRPKPSASLCMV